MGVASRASGGMQDEGRPPTVLVVDDEREIADLVAIYLRDAGYEPVVFSDPLDALAFLGEGSTAEAPRNPCDLAILDVMMPGVDGLELLRRIRARYAFPVIMLTAKAEQPDKIAGLGLGADDYVTKPFLPLELVARVKAQLRRYTRYNAASAAGAGAAADDDQVFELAGLVLDVRTHACTLNGRELQLTPTEFELLRILLQRRGAVVSAEELYCQIWGESYYSRGSGSIAVHVRHLREKLGDSFENPTYIKTVWGCGYKAGV